VKNQIPTSLRRPEEREAARRLADALLRGDRRRARKMAANDALGSAAPAPTKKRQDSPFAALRDHPLYRAGGFRRNNGEWK
jgi:hypothetical protein